eukprot:4924176-Amphidinium_carterae.1
MPPAERGDDGGEELLEITDVKASAPSVSSMSAQQPGPLPMLIFNSPKVIEVEEAYDKFLHNFGTSI